MIPARLASLAYELPATLVSDADLARKLRIPIEHVAALAAGRSRRFAADGVGPSALSAGAAKRALDSAGMEPKDVDFILFSTNTPDFTFPGSACLLQAELGCGTVGCLDVRAVCSGFVVAIDLARRYVGTGTYSRVLVASAEVPSHQNRFDGVDPELSCLMSDAASAAIVTAGAGELELLASRSYCDGSGASTLWCEFPASRHRESSGVARGQRLTRAAIDDGRIFPRVDLESLHRTALQRGPEVLDAVLREAGVEQADVIVVAHLNPETERALSQSLASRAHRVVAKEHLYAYSVTLPVALARALELGAIARGETVALLTVGGGASWGACVLRA